MSMNLCIVGNQQLLSPRCADRLAATERGSCSKHTMIIDKHNLRHAVRRTGSKAKLLAVADDVKDVSTTVDISDYYDLEAHDAALCDGGLPGVDAEMCEVLTSPPKPKSLSEEAWSRGRWLMGLLVLQSTSSFVLDAYQELLQQHLVVTLFLTMLVGAGGNAGNQSAIKVIRGLATGQIAMTSVSIRNTLKQQAVVGLLLGTGLAAGGFVRVYLTNGDPINAGAISLSLFLIVMTSVVAGTAMPFALAKLGVDPANAGTSIQVVMDITGVAITCVCCSAVLNQFASGVLASS